MNKQIKDLWEESQQWNGSDDGRGGLKIHESVEKFAELIVKECAWLVNENDISLPYGTFGELIKQHFGVEE
jgi:hypothetical protein